MVADSDQLVLVVAELNQLGESKDSTTLLVLLPFAVANMGCVFS